MTLTAKELMTITVVAVGVMGAALSLRPKPRVWPNVTPEILKALQAAAKTPGEHVLSVDVNPATWRDA